jgi:hypothetical protein
MESIKTIYFRPKGILEKLLCSKSPGKESQERIRFSYWLELCRPKTYEKMIKKFQEYGRYL